MGILNSLNQKIKSYIAPLVKKDIISSGVTSKPIGGSEKLTGGAVKIKSPKERREESERAFREEIRRLLNEN